MSKYISTNEELRTILRECINELLEARIRKAPGFEDMEDDQLSMWSRERGEETEMMPVKRSMTDDDYEEDDDDDDITQTLPTGYPDFNLPMDLYHGYQYAVNNPKLAKNRQKDEPLMKRLQRRFFGTRGKKIREAEVRKYIKQAILNEMFN